MLQRSALVSVAAVACLFIPLSAHATIEWVGSTSNDIFDEANWDLTGSAVTVIDPNVSIEDDVLIGMGPFANNPVIPELPGQVRFQLADGRALDLDGGTLDIAGNDGVGGEPGTADGPTVNVISGAAFNPFFVVNDVLVNIDGLSAATFGGGGNPINLSTLDLTPGAVLTFLNETADAYRAEHLTKTFVLGEAAVEGVNITIVPDGTGSIITAIPEPSSLALTGLAGLALLMRRRRK